MILAFSTLGIEPAEQRFYGCIENAVNTDVTWFHIAAAPCQMSDREIHLGWDLTHAQCTDIANEQNDPNEILPPSELALWVNRWERITGESKETLELSLRSYADGIRKWLDILRPSMVLVSSNSVPHTGIPFYLAKERSIPTAAFERGYLPESYQISDHGSGPFSNWSDVPFESLVHGRDAATMQSVGEAEIDLIRRFPGSRAATTKDEPSEDSATRDARIRVLFPPVADNTFSVYPVDHPDHNRIMPAFHDSIDVARQLYASPQLDVVVKPHPTEAHSARWRDVPRDWRISHGDVMSWIEWADVVVCNGSTLEFSALARGKPVVLAGRSILSAKGIAHEVSEAGQLGRAIETAVQQAEDPERQHRFALFVGWLKAENLILPQREDPSRSHTKLLQQLQDHGLRGSI